MRTLRFGLIFLASLLAVVPASASSVIIANFESGSPSGWTLTGTAWKVVGAAEGYTTGDGAYAAFSGIPGIVSGDLAQHNTGAMLSPAFAVSYDTLLWKGLGWSGATYNGLEYYEILDSNLAVKATRAAVQADSWTTVSVNLIDAGFHAGDTFYFRAVDNNGADAYSWFAFDSLELTGTSLGNGLGATPEPGTTILLLSGMAVLGYSWKRR